MSASSPTGNPTVAIRTNYDKATMHFLDNALTAGFYNNQSTGLTLSGSNIASTATLSAGRMFVTYQTPVANNELASKGYVDASSGAGTLTGLFDVTDIDPIPDNYTIVFNNAIKSWDVQLLNLTESVAGTLPIANGGTNQTSYTNSHLLSFNGTSIASSDYKADSYALSSAGTINTVAKFTTGGNKVINSSMIEDGTKLDLNLSQLQLNTIYLRENGNDLLLNDTGGTIVNKNLRALDVFVEGNLYVSGSTVSISSEEVYIADNFLMLNSNFTTGTPTQDAGLEVRRGTENSYYMVFQESTNEWGVGLGSPSGSATFGGSFTAFALAGQVGEDIFKTINIANGTDPVATSPTDTLAIADTTTISGNGTGSNTINFSVIGKSLYNTHISDTADIAWSKINKTGSVLNDLGNVSVASPGVNELLYWNNTNWVSSGLYKNNSFSLSSHTHSGYVDGSSALSLNAIGPIPVWTDNDTISGSTMQQKSYQHVVMGNVASTTPVTWLDNDQALIGGTDYTIPYVINSTSGQLQAVDTTLYFHYDPPKSWIGTNFDFKAVGDIYGSAKYFDIEHPDPNKDGRLVHASVETNALEVYYKGKGSTDISGKGIIQLPSYFRYLVHKDTITCHLTVLDSFDPITYSEMDDTDFENNQIRVRSLNRDINFTYLVYAERKDKEKLIDEILEQ